MVGEKDQQVVKSERGKTEGSLGRLKEPKIRLQSSPGAEFGNPDRSRAKGRSCRSNLNTLMRDLVEQAKTASLA